MRYVLPSVYIVQEEVPEWLINSSRRRKKNGNRSERFEGVVPSTLQDALEIGSAAKNQKDSKEEEEEKVYYGDSPNSEVRPLTH